MNDQVRVIKHDTIPPLPNEWEGGIHHLRGVRDLSRSPELREFIPEGAQFSPSWMELRSETPWVPCPAPTLLMVSSGSGEVFRGEESWRLSPGQVVLLDAGERFGLAAGPEGLRLLKIEFRPEPCAPAAMGSSSGPAWEVPTWSGALGQLMSYNQTREAEFLKGSLFRLLAGERMRQGSTRNQYLQHRRVWLLGCQDALLSRQTSCDDPTFSREFTTDLREELAQHDLLASDQARPDPALSALSSWFGYQMYVMDDVEKLAITHLVLARANGARELGELAAFGGTPSDASATERRIVARMRHRLERATTLLSQQSQDVQTRLRKTVGDAWDMAHAAAERLTELTS